MRRSGPEDWSWRSWQEVEKDHRPRSIGEVEVGSRCWRRSMRRWPTHCSFPASKWEGWLEKSESRKKDRHKVYILFHHRQREGLKDVHFLWVNSCMWKIWTYHRANLEGTANQDQAKHCVRGRGWDQWVERKKRRAKPCKKQGQKNWVARRDLGLAKTVKRKRRDLVGNGF